MRIFFVFQITLYLFVGAIFSVSAQPIPLDFSVKNEDNSLLFKVTGKGLKRSSYLYGTVHAICDEDVNIPPVLVKSLKSSKNLFLEVDMDNMKELFLAQINLVLPADSSLSKLLSPEEFQVITDFFRDTLHKDIGMYENIRPILIGGSLYPNLYNCKKPHPFEADLMEIARQKGIEVLGLESIKDQIAAFDKIPLRYQAESLLTQIKAYDYRAIRTAYDSMYYYYKKNDLVRLTRILLLNEQMSANIRGYEHILLFERNERWIEVILSAARSRPCFFAFGAAHLVGDKGIIELLRKRGYKVQAVKY